MANGRFDIEARFKGFDDRISTVETALVSLDKKFDATHHETSAVLKDIQKSLAYTQAKQGPGFMTIMYGIAAAATVLGIICSGITMLVGSQFSGPMSQMQTTLTTLAEAKKDSDREDAQELRELKTLRRAEYEKVKDRVGDLSDRLREIEARQSWTPTVKVTRR
jgi:hypothetical protein